MVEGRSRSGRRPAVGEAESDGPKGGGKWSASELTPERPTAIHKVTGDTFKIICKRASATGGDQGRIYAPKTL